MYQNDHKAKIAIIKTLAIIGFVAAVVLIVWLSIQALRVLPNTFASLANILESLQENRPATELTIATEKNIVNSGESFQVSWTNLGEEGTYQFAYECTDGVAIDIRSGADATAVSCGSAHTISGSDQTMDLIVSSEKRRFTDVPFSLRFVRDGEILFDRDGKVTVVNATIPLSSEVAGANDTETGTEEDSETTEATDDSAPLGTGTEQRTQYETVTYYPQSYESGFTDLKISFEGGGILIGDTFVPQSLISNDTRGALQLTVKNIGTKTSEPFAISVTLPGGGTFTSDEHSGLRPNEQELFTLGFYLDEDTEGVTAVEGSVETERDTNSANDAFRRTVTIID